MSPVPFSQKAAKGCFPLKTRKGRLHGILETETNTEKGKVNSTVIFKADFRRAMNQIKKATSSKQSRSQETGKDFFKMKLIVLTNKFDSLKEDLNNWWSIGD